jgi:hypothetical protein
MQGGWQPASVLDAREGHTATLLHNGQVLVHGGVEYIISTPPEPMKILRTADLYHPDTNEWIEAASTAIERFLPTATLLPDGSVLVVGGAKGSSTGWQPVLETEIWNPTVPQVWSFTRHPLNFARWQHAATLLQDGKVLVVGGEGVGGTLSSSEIFDPATQEWTAAGNLNKPKTLGTATLLSDGRVLFVGGVVPLIPPLISAEVFDQSRLPAWTPAEDLRSGSRVNHTATLLSDGTVLVAGGATVNDQLTPLKSCEIFDPVTGHWADTGNMNEPRKGHTATLLRRGDAPGTVMVVGGGFELRADQKPWTNLQTSEFFNPVEGTWTRGPDMSVPRSGASQTLLRWDRHEPLVFKVLVAGGRSSPSTNTLDSAELFTGGDVNV